MWKKKITNPFDSYMLNKVRRLKDVRTRSAATGWVEKFAETTVRQYLDGLKMYGLKDDYCYFGHQRGLDDMGECFLGPDGGLDFAYVRCNSREGFEFEAMSLLVQLGRHSLLMYSYT